LVAPEEIQSSSRARHDSNGLRDLLPDCRTHLFDDQNTRFTSVTRIVKGKTRDC
jgi:hypothetical protein